MRICFFNRSYWPDFGATGQLLTELAEDLVQHHGFQVSVVAGLPLHILNGESRVVLPIRREERNGVEIVRCAGTRLSPRGFIGRVTNYVTYFATACFAGVTIARPDVIVALTDPPIIGIAALMAAKRTGAKFVFLCQDVFPEVARVIEDFRSERVDRALDYVNRVVVRKADRVIALGETMRERLVRTKGAQPEKVTVIHNWADCAAIAPGDRMNAFASAVGVADKFVVMHAGNIGLSQNLDVVLDAAALLRRYRDIALVFVGDGSKREMMERRVREERLTNVRFVPYQPREAMSLSYAAADVFIVSLRPGLAGYIVPSKLYGILAAGRPYIAAVEGECEVAAITREHRCGLLSEPGKPADLADKILKLYHDRKLCQQMGEAGRKAALAFDRPVQVSKYHDLFRTLARATTR